MRKISLYKNRKEPVQPPVSAGSIRPAAGDHAPGDLCPGADQRRHDGLPDLFPAPARGLQSLQRLFQCSACQPVGREVPPQALRQTGHQGGVPIQQPEGYPPGRQPSAQSRLQFLRQPGCRSLNGGGIGHPAGRRWLLPLRYCLHRVHQPLQSLPPARRCPHHRNAQPAGQGLQVHLDPLAPGLIHQVDAHHRPGRDLQGLEHQIQVSFQTGGVADHDGGVRPAEAEEIPGHLFLRRVGQQGVSTRQVHQDVVAAMAGVAALGVGHRLSGPVPCLL